jgi:hypothetical protein
MISPYLHTLETSCFLFPFSLCVNSGFEEDFPKNDEKFSSKRGRNGMKGFKLEVGGDSW